MKDIDEALIFDSMLSLITSQIRGNNDIPIVEFAEEIVFNGSPHFKLFPQQKAVLKALYHEPLTSEEREILKDWSYLGKTNWVEDRKYTTMVLEAGRRGSKALSIYTDILTLDGWKLMGDIEVGDIIFDESARITRVEAVTPIMYDHDVYKILFSDGSIIKADGEHLWSVQSEHTIEAIILTTEEIKEALGHTIYYVENKGFIEGFPPNYKRNIVDIIPIESEPVKCISVNSPSHIFLAGKTLIPTHNSTIASVIALYEFYNLITLKDIAQKYNILPNDPIAIFVIAQSQAQAKETIFAKIKGYAENSFYFKGMADAGEIEILSEEIRCAGKNVGIYAKHTNSKALVGYSLKCLILDEAARFETSQETGENSAFDIYYNIAKGLSAFHGAGKKVAISSAWEIGDPIEVLAEQSKDDPRTMSIKLTTFDLNPTMTRDSDIIASDYIVDYEKARLEYEGIRTSKQGTFIPRINVEKACTGISCIDAHGIDLDVEVAGDKRYYVGVDIDRIEYVDRGPSFAHVDPALKKDSAALAVASSIKLEDGRVAIKVDGVLKWTPRRDKKANKREVSFTDMEEKILMVCKARKVQLLTFDSWNSSSMIQRLHVNGITTREISSSRDKQLVYYTLLRDLLSQGLVILPRDSTWTGDIKSELSSLVKKPNNQIVHPYAGKDIADAICLAVYHCYLYQVNSGLMASINPKVTRVKTNPNLPAKQHTKALQVGESIRKALKSIR